MNSTLSNVTLDELLETKGFAEWKILLCIGFFPLMSTIGIICNALSLWIFSTKRVFALNPVFFYYRLLCLVFLVHSLHHAPIFICFCPGNVFGVNLVPSVNTYYTSIYMAYNLVASNFMFHYEEVLQIAILLMRMRNFMPFGESHFKATPK